MARPKTKIQPQSWQPAAAEPAQSVPVTTPEILTPIEVEAVETQQSVVEIVEPLRANLGQRVNLMPARKFNAANGSGIGYGHAR